MQLRKPTSDELRVLESLISKAVGFPHDENWKAKLRVAGMNDGGMGSLRLFPKGIVSEKRVFGRQLSDCKFADADGTQVVASLNADQNGELFELDIWKTDFGKLLRIPEQITETPT